MKAVSLHFQVGIHVPVIITVWVLTAYGGLPLNIISILMLMINTSQIIMKLSVPSLILRNFAIQ
jgi:hypothetical protein